ncbi:LAQU0S10e02982g1_1 [Lachancea quebecensis]|uniref:LAQU0S10e02982g1_1 n=1 Tax=Lachancea quebecensis TaxID=1654605 RepID=A0A0P1KUJ1_9SACH|nr:LAQU0S10e02982g1_1 [Lachancea quebecensis]
MYLLRRRLRHLKTISIFNVSLIKEQGNSAIEIKAVPSVFIVIEDLKGRCIYVSETQAGTQLYAQFNELPQLSYAISKVRLRIIGKVPGSLLKDDSEEAWVVLADHVLNFNQLHPVPDKDMSLNLFKGVNIPALYFSDGVFTLSGTTQSTGGSGNRAPFSTMTRAKTFNFNSVLKLNKLLEYSSELHSELCELSNSISSEVPDQRECYSKNLIIEAKKKLEDTIRLRKERIKYLQVAVHEKQTPPRNLVEDSKFNEDYGSTFFEYSDTKHHLKTLKARRMQQLFQAMQETKLFTSSGLVIPDSEQSIFHAHLRKLNAMSLARDSNRISTNTLLGHYLLFLHILSEKILFVRLPHRLSYYGSTSVINNRLPLYLTSSPTQQHVADFERAVDLFNLDIMQVRQFLERHR